MEKEAAGHEGVTLHAYTFVSELKNTCKLFAKVGWLNGFNVYQ